MCSREDGALAVTIKRTYSSNLEVASKILASARNDQIERNTPEIVRERERF
jgi:hypothetical protein